MKTNTILKRVGAYFIDFLIITLISSSLSYLSFLNPKYEKYIDVSSKYNEAVNDYYDKKISLDDLNNITKDLSYDLNKNGYVYVIGDIVIVFLYFGVFNYYTKGQTLGKKLMNLKIVTKDNQNPTLIKYFIRAFITYSVILKILTLIAINFKPETFSKIFSSASNFDSLLMLVIFLSIMISPTGRGIHDYLAGTKVIDLKNNREEEDQKEVEAEITNETAKEKPQKAQNKKNVRTKNDEN